MSRCARHDSAFVVDMTALLLGTDPSIWKESGAFGPSIYAVMLSTEIKCAKQKRCHVDHKSAVMSSAARHLTIAPTPHFERSEKSSRAKKSSYKNVWAVLQNKHISNPVIEKS